MNTLEEAWRIARAEYESQVDTPTARQAQLALVVSIDLALRVAISEERERCARVVEGCACGGGQAVWKLLAFGKPEPVTGDTDCHDYGVVVDRKPIAAAIRKGDPDEPR